MGITLADGHTVHYAHQGVELAGRRADDPPGITQFQAVVTIDGIQGVDIG